MKALNDTPKAEPQPTMLVLEVTLFDEAYVLGFLATLKNDSRVVSIGLLA